MHDNDLPLHLESDGITLPATLTLPVTTPVRGGLIPLHPADNPSREQLLFRQLADLLPPRGIAVLRFDRRQAPDGRDVPLEAQARDALAALRTLRQSIGEQAPIGLWGWSQGAWAAPLAASHSSAVAFLLLVASPGVSPAQQMRYGTAEQLRRAGYGADALADLARLRVAYEAYQRGQAARAPVQALIDTLAQQPWFPLTYVPRALPAPGSWADMDFDPAAIFAQVRCPMLLFYGEEDEWVPVDESIAAWEHAAAQAGNTDLTLVRLPATSHAPTLRGGPDNGPTGGTDSDVISPLYTERLLAWVEEHVEPPTPC